MIQSKICEMLGIEYPVFQGGMAWIADGKLAAAVSEGGGLGIIAAGNAPGEHVREQIRIAKALTSKPIGVNIMLMSPYADEVASIVTEEGVAVVTTGAGNPSKYMKAWQEADIKVIPVVASVAMAKLMTRLGASALIAEGGESGGHVGELTTMVLVPQICDATTLPVLAAGGIADGRGVAASFMLGACGVQMGTRFLSAEECTIHPVYREKILKATDLCTTVTGRRLGHTKLMEKGARRVSPLFVPMMIANMAAGAIAIRHDCRGAAMPAVTACASGSNAIGEAMRLIRHNYADAVITGGSEAAICASAIAGFVNMQALSVSEDVNAASLPFDQRRAGFVIGEGAVALVLEEYEHAKARGAQIYGEVCGYGSTCDAYHITAPHPEARGGAQAMKDAMREAGYTGKETVYINAHGTGTPMNDSTETLAIKTALGEEAAANAYISSTKSMTGHMLGAAGAVEAMACLLALKEGVIPPTINLNQSDPSCDLNYVPNRAVKAEIDLALSNSLGFGGHNACLAFRKV